MASFTEKYEFEDEFTEALHMSDMMQFVLASKVRPPPAAAALRAPIASASLSSVG